MTIDADKIITLPFYHQDQPDRPNVNFPSSLALKQAFDSSTIAIQTAMNSIIDDLMSIIPGVSGSEQIGSAPIVGVVGANIYAQLAFIESQVQAIVGAAIPPGTVTTAMIQDNAVTTSKIASEAVTFAKLEKMLKTAANGGLVYAQQNFYGF